MKVLSSHFVCLAFAVLCSLSMFDSVALAQEETRETNQEDAKQDGESEATKVMQQIHKHIKDKEWSNVKSCMTEEAWHDWCHQLVRECITVANMDMDLGGIEVPGLEDSQDAIHEALEEYKLDKIEVANPAIEIEMGGPGGAGDGDESKDEEDETDADDSSEESTEKVDETKQEILDALGTGDDRLKIIQSLWEARSGSPFSFSVFGGEIKKEQAADQSEEAPNQSTILLTITPAVAESGDPSSGVMFQVMAPPIVVNIDQDGQVWKYAGINDEKTAEAMKDFKPEMMGGGADFDDF